MKKRNPRPKTKKKKKKGASIARSNRASTEPQSSSAESCLSKLTDLFLQHNPADVCIVLNISDLWIPNIASQIRHIFAFRVLASIEPLRFSGCSKLETYGDFRGFLTQVYKCLPTFPTLEDYVPEADWGEIRISSNGEQKRLLYGGSIERLPDFIEAFRFTNNANPQGLSDLHAVLLLQDALLSAIPRTINGDEAKASPGHLEVPAEPFWERCRDAFVRITNADSAHAPALAHLTTQLGTLAFPTNLSRFADMIMSGTALPLRLQIDAKQYPISLRNTVGTVIDYWATRAEATAGISKIDAQIASFLSARFSDRELFAGPLTLSSPTHEPKHRFAAIIHSGQILQFVISIHENELKNLVEIESDLLRFFSDHDEWGIRLDKSNRVGRLTNGQGEFLKPKQVGIIAIIVSNGTSLKLVRKPKTNAQLLWLPDFFTIFDSLKDCAELFRFWSYLSSTDSMLGPSFVGTADLFATFRDSHGVVVEGAISPNLIFFDPHWGSNWRYRELSEFWKNAPAEFPDDQEGAWKPGPLTDGIQQLISAAQSASSWSTSINGCVLHFVFEAFNQPLDSLNGRMLELVTQCLADSLFQRSEFTQGVPIFDRKRVVTVCRADQTNLARESLEDTTNDAPIFSGWRLVATDPLSPRVLVFVNLARVQTELIDAADSRFEAECAEEWLSAMEGLLNTTTSQEWKTLLKQTASRIPRFSLAVVPRSVDTPDHVDADVPEPNQYKSARKELAITFRSLNISPGKYELAEAKAAIDPARDTFRTHIHQQIAQFDQNSLILYCIKQHEALATEYLRTTSRVRHSLTHQVNFDRSASIAEAYEKFTTNARNYRYLLEVCLSGQSHASTPVTAERAMELLAKIDWLFVLYIASDVLHNDIEVAGVELNQSFVPDVFYSSDREETGKAFGHEMANVTLGLGLDDDDAVVTTRKHEALWHQLDKAFVQDCGFSFSQMAQVLQTLSRWQTARGQKQFELCYEASIDEINGALRKILPNIGNDEIDRILIFLMLDPTNIRRLVGKTQDEGDVPIWEHTKRTDRYTIKPLIPLDGNMRAWGAAGADRSLTIWSKSIANGYLPADFPWPHVHAAVRAMKDSLEKRLEAQAGSICSRTTLHLENGIDFMRRFPKERFEDVGDFDVLAYWPETATWLAVECKYNQPPFCLKDARRLRERIFGRGDGDKGQFSKIERRSGFLRANLDRVRQVLNWPSAAISNETIREVYVSREIYWWMRHPPYEVATEFVRVDALDSWIRSQILSAASKN